MPGGDYLSWGRYPRVRHRQVYRLSWQDQAAPRLAAAAAESLLPTGLQRSYGDSCLNAGRDLLSCRRLDRILAADFEQGWLRCEAGTTLAEILAVTVPHNWFLPVVPGTQQITLGGAIANDIHGKNHHRAGSFGRHVRQFGLCRSDAPALVCSPAQNAELYRATIGGLGLTGIILWAEIELKPIPGPGMDVNTMPFNSLEQFLELNAQQDRDHEYTVAWFDCLAPADARGVLFSGNHSPAPAGRTRGEAKPAERQWKIPFPLPQWWLNAGTIRLLNAAYRLRQRRRPRQAWLPYAPFFFPLDQVVNWNLGYGRAGFLQYQCRIPERLEVCHELLRTIARSGRGSFLAVLKKFGDLASPGLLSFPQPGLTLALDFPMRGQATLELLAALDRIVFRYGGGLYPAKDARMPAEAFQRSFPGWREFLPYLDPKLSSSFWRRVTGA